MALNPTSLDQASAPPSARRKPFSGALRFVLSALGAFLVSTWAPVAADASTPQDTGFLSMPTDQVAVPGLNAGAEITPEGDLYTGWAEYELRFGSSLRRWNQPTRVLGDPSLPILSSTLHDGTVQYTDTIFAAAVAGAPVAYETVSATNDSDRPQRAQIEMLIAYTRGQQVRGAHRLLTGSYRYERPAAAAGAGFYEQPGQAFSPMFSYSIAGRDLDRSGLLLARGPTFPSRAVGAGPSRAPLTATHDARLFRARLKAHGHIGLTWQIPLSPPAVGAGSDRALDGLSASSALAQLRDTWRTEEAGMMKIELPEAKVTRTYRSAVTEMLQSRVLTPAGWIQNSNKLQYQAFWIRDAAVVTQALDLVGLHRQAAQNLAFLDSFQQPDGLFISRAQQYDGLGQALWALAQHAELTGSVTYAQDQLSRMQAAIDWLSAAVVNDHLGLLPAGNPHDDELAYGHTTGDDLWAAAGLRSAVADATLSGRPGLAATWQSVDRRFEGSLDRAIAVAVARAGHITPDIEASHGQDWGNYYASYPVQVLAASSPAVESTSAWARAHMVEGLPTYDNGRSLHDYLGFSIFQTELAAGEPARAIAGLYAELVHTTSTNGGWEWDVTPFGHRDSAVDLAPHGTFAGDYVALLRNMLVADRGAGVELMAGASPAWLAPGQRVSVTDASTDHGVISFTERSTARGETLSWKSSLAPGTPLSWRLPAWARRARVAGGPVAGRIVLSPANAGSLTVEFVGVRPRQSYASSASALDAAYLAHGRRAPLTPMSR